MELDAAVIELLSVDPAQTRVESAGGGGCSSASTSVITTTIKDGNRKRYFMKSGSGDDARVMFEGEHASLRAIHEAVPSLCPQSYGSGKFSNSSTYFLVTDFIDLTARSLHSSKQQSPLSLAAKLAQLHGTPAPMPHGQSHPVFGFPVVTCCGDTPQDNSYENSWSKFYADRRLRFILGRSERANGKDAELRDLVESTIEKVVPRLLSDQHLNNGKGVTPVVVHGDLWSGNAGRGLIEGQDSVQDIVYDPSSCYAHNEYELGIMRIFGGFDAKFTNEYHQHCPKSEPENEYEDRVALYGLYHYLNHHALFGGGYRSKAVAVMKQLLFKYGVTD